jgi:hypothetical protein
VTSLHFISLLLGSNAPDYRVAFLLGVHDASVYVCSMVSSGATITTDSLSNNNQFSRYTLQIHLVRVSSVSLIAFMVYCARFSFVHILVTTIVLNCTDRATRLDCSLNTYRL